MSRALLLAWLALAAPRQALAQGTAFTYQGRLYVGGFPAHGTYDFRFSLWKQASGAGQLGIDLIRPALAVTRGLFTATLDFGTNFPGEGRWLEIAVRTNGAASYGTLAPRQPITSSPYAITARQLTGPLTLAQLPSGSTFASTTPADPQAVAAGLRLISRTPAPAWADGSADGAPSARTDHSSVWTGQEMIVWGGLLGTAFGGPQYSGTGAAYEPEADAWAALTALAAPSARRSHTAEWTGSEMIVWGGFSGTDYLATGGRFDRGNQTWRTVVPSPLAARDSHVAVWTGDRMLIWGGRNDTSTLADGATYDPASAAWTMLIATGAPEARAAATAIWTGDRLIIWGGEGDTSYLGTGAQLGFAGGVPAASWQGISATGAPTGRSGHTAVWTGSRMLVWGGSDLGGKLGDGAAYDPVANAWTPISGAGAPTARDQHDALWTGSEMVIYGGRSAGGATASGAAYDPATDHWRALSNPGAPQARSGSTATWTGTEALFFGGRNNAGGTLSALQRLDPQPAWYLFRKP